MGIEVRILKKTKAGIEPLEMPSALHPAHPFKIGKFTSDYSESGFDKTLKRLTGYNLLSLFGLTRLALISQSEIQPNWRTLQSRLSEIQNKVSSHLTNCGGFHNVQVVAKKLVNPPLTTQKALEVFCTEVSKAKQDNIGFGNFSTENGDFFLSNPWKVVAVIPSGNEQFPVFLICEENMSWYIEGINIIAETIQYILNSPEGESHYTLSWSE